MNISILCHSYSQRTNDQRTISVSRWTYRAFYWE